MSAKTLISFASSNISKAPQRFRAQAEALGVFDEIIIHDEYSLDEDFRRRHAGQLKSHVRGFGYWAWKPQIIAQTMKMMDQGELLCYCDIGCHLNPAGRPRLLEYLAMLEKTANGMLAFQRKKTATNLAFDDRHYAELTDHQWTKGDVLRYFDVVGYREITHTPTVGAGIIFFRKNALSEHVVSRWLEAINADFSLVDDSPSASANLPGFVEHRHDQALFSILAKLHQVKTLSAYEYWYPDRQHPDLPDWTMLQNHPFHARRDLKLGLINRLMLQYNSAKKKLREI